MSDSRIAYAARRAASWWGGRLEKTEFRAAFESALVPLIEAEIQTEGESYLKVDYDPQGILLTALQAAGIECRGYMFSARGIFPNAKMALKVTVEKMRPKESYGNWTDEILFTNPEAAAVPTNTLPLPSKRTT